ncbi:hypothetical protein HOD96_01425 [Candidatus Falkowbacteria bacterium]|nr:hypothetical protein [Candidatus Falkowbacteria bacterium]
MAEESEITEYRVFSEAWLRVAKNDPNILIVEDDHSDRHRFVCDAQEVGLIPCIAVNISEGIMCLRQQKWDYVLWFGDLFPRQISTAG